MHVRALTVARLQVLFVHGGSKPNLCMSPGSNQFNRVSDIFNLISSPLLGHVQRGTRRSTSQFRCCVNGTVPTYHVSFDY